MVYVMHVRVLLSVIVWILNMSTPHLSEFSKIWKEYKNVDPVYYWTESILARFALYTSAQLITTHQRNLRLWPRLSVSTEVSTLTVLDAIINCYYRNWAMYRRLTVASSVWCSNVGSTPYFGSVAPQKLLVWPSGFFTPEILERGAGADSPSLTHLPAPAPGSNSSSSRRLEISTSCCLSKNIGIKQTIGTIK